MTDRAEIVVIGAGAAGLATAIFCRRLVPHRRVVLLEGAKRPGAKIMVSGGSRCNVTNARVTERDFNGGRRTIIRAVLRRFTSPETVAFFAGLGVPLHEEAGGKLFPDSNRARDVLDALLGEAGRLRVDLRPAHRVGAVERADGGFHITTGAGTIDASIVVLATGGRALPKSGSDGAGFELARALGHTIVPTTPALVPLVMDGDVHVGWQGIALPVELTLAVNERVTARVTGSLLWTHFGISGPAALDMSRHWLRATLDGHRPRLTASFAPGETFETMDARWTRMVAARPRQTVSAATATFVPAAMAEELLRRVDVTADAPLAHLPRDSRRRLVRALVAFDLPVTGSRGYTHAEATAGGVSLDEIQASTMSSRVCPGLYLVGEVLDVDGRIGGFNFQWAWSSARVAAEAIAGGDTPSGPLNDGGRRSQ